MLDHAKHPKDPRRKKDRKKKEKAEADLAKAQLQLYKSAVRKEGGGGRKKGRGGRSGWKDQGQGESGACNPFSSGRGTYAVKVDTRLNSDREVKVHMDVPSSSNSV